MIIDASIDWQQANQRYLAESLSRVRQLLKRRIAGAESYQEASPLGRENGIEEPRFDETSIISVPSSLETIIHSFGLTTFETDILLLCAGFELDFSFGELCSQAQGDVGRPYPTFSLALAALPNPHWTAIVSGAPLRRWRMLEVGPGSALSTSPLRIDERILHYLAGVSCPDGRLRGLIEPLAIKHEGLPEYLRGIALRIQELWSRKEGLDRWPLIQLCGRDDADKLDIAQSTCSALGVGLCSMEAHDIPDQPQEREALASLWEREAILSSSALFIDLEDGDASQSGRNLISFSEALGGMVIIASREPICFRRRLSVRLDVPEPDAREREDIWRSSLGACFQVLDGDLEEVASQFGLGLHGIRSASFDARIQRSKDPQDMRRRLWEACRSQARPRMEGLAQLIEPTATWDDLVLPIPQLQLLREIAIHARRRAKVYDSWGFKGKGLTGLGISALFTGSSGTGKTMAAEVLANELNLDLFRVDLSRVVSKYIGETEKNLGKIFDAAEGGGAILLFDEADSLFGKRSEVRDSHDRYANVEISYLLQRMEVYRGLAILTTNMKNSLDFAFLRRIRFIVQFPFPDANHRAEIWRRIFPLQTPTEGLDVAKLSRLDVSGGSIRNIALYGTFLAADEGRPVGMKHLVRAARVEYAKMERPLNESEMRWWS
ncbi:MAG TPA: AAA family ATPase [Methanotrichaceae archaeon]|nr:AAA family ATPase [Methanotrichaceae archaeon]HQI91222.1 AAA family ATPase [Methanotrichaceae archaeon]